MKILLAACNAKYIHSNLAVYNLKSCSGEYSPNVVIKEYTINQIQDDILKDIYLEQPDRFGKSKGVNLYHEYY